MNDIIKTNIWNLFRSEFKDGEQVIIVHENCKLYGGKLTAYENRCIVGGKEFSWGEIVFIAHDGFPCRELHTCMSNEELADIENYEHVLLMRKLFIKKMSEPLLTCPKPKTTYTRTRRFHSYGGGCPYLFEEVAMQIINPYNGLIDNFEETLLCLSKDGALGMLWGLDDEIIEFYEKKVA